MKTALFLLVWLTLSFVGFYIVALIKRINYLKFQNGALWKQSQLTDEKYQLMYSIYKQIPQDVIVNFFIAESDIDVNASLHRIVEINEEILSILEQVKEG